MRLKAVPAHTGPLFDAVGEGRALTVRVAVTAHVVGRVYEIVVVPDVTPVTSPVDEFMVATAVLELAQVPPGVALLRSVVEFTHTDKVPVIGSGRGLTVMARLAVAPVPHVFSG